MVMKTWHSLLVAVTVGSAVAQDAQNPGLATPNGVYNGSVTPASFPWNTYNYCNAPHVNVPKYAKPNVSDAKLVYLNTVIRHHKRTPDNLYPAENPLNTPWDCSDFQQFNFGGPNGSSVFHKTDTPPWHPFLINMWNGTCDMGQLTRGGFDDAIKHGQDYWGVYSNTTGLLLSVNEKDIFVRTSVETRTMQVASALIVGMDPTFATKTFPVTTQPSAIDSIPPNYPCPQADAVRDAFQSVPAWLDHIMANQPLKDRLDAMLGTAGLSAWSVWYDHFFDTFTSRTCSGHELPCNATGACVSQQDAATVFSIGDFEYNYIWNAAQNASVYNSLTTSVLLQELLMNFQLFQSGNETFKLRFYAGHDGTMVRLASALGFGKIQPLRWPALGSEINMEVWQSNNSNFVRVLHEGTVVPTFEWQPLGDFISLLSSAITPNLFTACNATS